MAVYSHWVLAIKNFVKDFLYGDFLYGGFPPCTTPTPMISLAIMLSCWPMKHAFKQVENRLTEATRGRFPLHCAQNQQFSSAALHVKINEDIFSRNVQARDNSWYQRQQSQVSVLSSTLHFARIIWIPGGTVQRDTRHKRTNVDMVFKNNNKGHPNNSKLCFTQYKK